MSAFSVAVLIALLQSNVPVFGSHYAGKPFFDAKQSEIVPSATAHCEGDGRAARQRTAAGPLRLVSFSPQEAKAYDFPQDLFHVLLSRNGRDQGYARDFYAPLSGYVPVSEADPDAWERSYSFRKAEGFASVVLRLRLGPRNSVWADADALDALRFPVREYCWRTPPGAYKLCHFEYAAVEK